MIYCDAPRRYRKRGKKWSHVFSPDLRALEAYARRHGLKRRDTSPFLHYDVTDEELKSLPGITQIPSRQVRPLMEEHWR